MKLILDSFAKNDEVQTFTLQSYRRFLDKGYKPIIKINKQYDVRPIQRPYLNFLDTLKKYQGEDLLIAEDDCYIDTRAEDLYPQLTTKNAITRIVWIKKGSQSNEYVGNQLTHVPKEFQSELITIMESYKPQCIDMFLSKRVPQIVLKSCGREIQHISQTTGKLRKGIILDV